MKKTVKYFIDMDGTLARFYDDADALQKMFVKGYFANLKPYEKMIADIRRLIKGGKEVYILTKCVSTEYCVAEKKEWLAKYLPELPAEKMIFICDDAPKSKAVKDMGLDNGINILIDDYGKNLKEWEQNITRGIAIKVLNNINGKGGSKYTRVMVAE